MPKLSQSSVPSYCRHRASGQANVKLDGKAAQQMVKLIDQLEDHEDTKKVWSNADIEEKEIEASLA